MIKRLTPKTAFGKNVLTVMTGGGLAQAIPILMSPVLTRLYSPEDFGFMALYLWVASLLTILATGKYEKSVYLPNRTKGVARIIDMSSKIRTCSNPEICALVRFRDPPWFVIVFRSV